ncbi:M20 family metallopeptidase [Vicingaceae bacterium]|nr:M20 family metallopeptidase [Vicingaceae bacterium]
MDFVSIIKQKANDYFGEIQAIRQHLHQYPELSFEEIETAQFIADKLTEYGIPFKSGIAGTGIVGTIEGKNPRTNKIALRADMDALPIIEKNEVAYKSTKDGIMHACGHDVHSACLLGTAKILNELRESFEGSIQLIFQPGEEKLPGGASLMIKEGVLEDKAIKGIVGQHVYPELETGKIGLRSGKYMASADELHVKVIGKGGHAALPQHTVDAVLMASTIIVSLQQLVSRNAPPTVPSVLSFGKIEGLGATNVLPDVVTLEGTFRTMDEVWREEAHKKMVRLAESIAEGMGGKCEFEVRKGYPFLTNDAKMTAEAYKAAQDYVGAENVIDLDLRMTAEDFSFYTHHTKGCFYRLGTGNIAKGITHKVHNAQFDIDEESIKIGMGFMAYQAICQLQMD